MRIFFIIIISIYIGVLTTTAQSSFYFSYGTSEDELLLNATVDYNNNVIIVGRVGDRATINYDPLILKVSPDGSFITKRLAKPDSNFYAQTVNLLPDSSYMITGIYGDSLRLSYDHLWVCKLDTNLEVIFEKSFNLIGESIYTSLSIEYAMYDNANNIVIVGGKNYGDFADMLLIKLNLAGDTLLTKTHPFQFEQRIIDFSCIPNSNDYLGISGLIGMHNYGPVRFDSVFNIIDIKHFPSVIENKGTSDKWINDTTYMYSCLSISQEHENMINVYHIDTAMYLHKSVELDKKDTTDYPAWRTSMAYANDSTVYVGGFINLMDFYPTAPNAIEIYLLDKELNILGYKEYGWDANYDLWGMLETSDNGCLLYGNVRTEDNTTESDVYIRKVIRDEFDITTSILSTNFKKTYSKAWPNPANEILFIGLVNLETTFVDISIFSLAGKKMTEQRVFGIGNTLEINVHTLPSGTYIYKLISPKDIVISGKFIKTN